MRKPLLGEKAAVLAANGFCETDLTEVQRLLQSLGATLRIVGMDHGLISSWKGDDWGLNFAADKVLKEALASDFSMLVIPGGQKSAEKLALTAHTGRFIKGFLDLRKPVIAFGESVGLLTVSGCSFEGVSLAGSESLKDRMEEAGAVWSQAPYIVHENIMTAGAMTIADGDQAAAVTGFLTSHYSLVAAA